MGRPEEAQRAQARLRHLPVRRYGWMRLNSGLRNLHLGRYDEAAIDLKACLHASGRFWRVRCLLAEVSLCQGDAPSAWNAFDRAAKRAAPLNRNQIFAWRGEALLWTGDYQEALSWLTQAINQCDYALCWRGAALMLVGKHEEALLDLNRAILPGSEDMEAFIWRGELFRRMGRHQESQKDFDRADRISSWAGDGLYVNRALLRHALGDKIGMRREFNRLDGAVVDFLAGHLRIPLSAAYTDDAVQRILNSGIQLFRGVRREPYLRAIWMRRAAATE
ncbi:MAG: tetratricopeptide repeat protein [Elusimicrobiota bacterium]